MVSLSSASKITSLVLFNLFVIILHDLVRADPPYQLCQGTTFTDTSPFQKNLNDLLSSLSSNASVTKFYNTSIGNDLDTVYGLFFCYGYVEKVDCVKCIAAASHNIRKLCQNKKEAVVWEENCQLRYSNQNFVGHLDVDGNINQTNPKNVSDPKRLQSLVNITLHNISNIAAFSPSSGMYATQDVPFSDEATVYALVQCTVDLSPDECNTCLEIAISNISSCCYFYRGARLLSRSCYLRYEFYHFYKVGTECHDSAPCPGTKPNKLLILYQIQE